MISSSRSDLEEVDDLTKVMMILKHRLHIAEMDNRLVLAGQDGVEKMRDCGRMYFVIGQPYDQRG